MVRVSLKEAYDNRDVIAWLMKHQEMLDELSDILNNLPDPDLTNVVLKTGDQTIEGIKTFTDPIISQGGVTLASGGLHIGGDLQVDGDIIQEGSSYETHAEQVFSKNDLIVTREDAVGAIVAGGISGIRVNKYDSVNNLNLGVDSTGVMRVGDVGDEQPLLTRDESENMTSGALLKWDGVNMKAIAPASDIGSDTKPIKIVNGQVIEVTRNLADFTPYQVSVFSTTIGNIQEVTGRLCYIRTGHKKGILSGCLKIASNTDPRFEVTSISKISQLIGIDFNIESGLTGSWMTNNTRNDFHGYGATINISSSGGLLFGRYHSLNDFGGWSLKDISDCYIMFQDVELTES